MLICTVALHETHLAETVISSIGMSEEKSNELDAPHLQSTYFFSETMAPPNRKSVKKD